MDLAAQPGDQRSENAARELCQDAGFGGARSGEELGGRDGAERVSREIAPAAARPVNVLEATLGVVSDGQAQKALHPGVESARQIVDGEGAVDHRALQVVAQQDVGGIGDLVGVNPDEARLHARIEPVQVGRPEGRIVAAEGLLQQRR